MSNGSIASTTSASTPLACSEPLGERTLRRVWERMGAMYPNKWRATMGDSPHQPDKLANGESNPRAGQLTIYADTWAKGLAGLSHEQLAAGLAACLTRAGDWFPEVQEFRELCLGIPTLQQVRADMARANQERAPFTVLVGRNLDGYRYRMVDARESDRMLREAYAEARAAVMRGEPLPKPLPQITQETEKPVPASPEFARARMAEIAAELGLPPRGNETGDTVDARAP